LLCLGQALQANGFSNLDKVFTAPNKMTKSDWSDINEMQRTWDAALVRIPRSDGTYLSAVMDKLPKQVTHSSNKYPTIIYLHGCAGIWQGTHTRLNIFASSGFAVIAPVSFARKKYPQSYDAYSSKGGMYRGTLAIRQHDAGYAIAKAKQLNWVDEKNVFLVGHSQGGITTTTFSSKQKHKSVNARVIEGWTCHSGWYEYNGINAPSDEAVMSLVASGDPWFKNSWSRGDCGAYINRRNGSQSIVLSKGKLSIRHQLLEDQSVQENVLEFLHRYIR